MCIFSSKNICLCWYLHRGSSTEVGIAGALEESEEEVVGRKDRVSQSSRRSLSKSNQRKELPFIFQGRDALCEASKEGAPTPQNRDRNVLASNLLAVGFEQAYVPGLEGNSKQEHKRRRANYWGPWTRKTFVQRVD